MAAMRLDLIGRYLRPHRKTVIFVAIAMVVVNVLSVTIPMEVRRVSMNCRSVLPMTAF